MSYHKTNFGSFSGHVQADIDGYVHTSIKDVMAGNWDEMGGRMTREQAAEIAAANRKATQEAEADLAEWRQKNA